MKNKVEASHTIVSTPTLQKNASLISTPTENDHLFAIAVVCHILDENSSGIKIEKKSIMKRMEQLQVFYFNI